MKPSSNDVTSRLISSSPKQSNVSHTTLEKPLTPILTESKTPIQSLTPKTPISTASKQQSITSKISLPKTIEARFRERVDAVLAIMKEILDAYLSLPLYRLMIEAAYGKVNILEQVKSELKQSSDEKIIDLFVKNSHKYWNEIKDCSVKTTNKELSDHLLRLVSSSPSSGLSPEIINMVINQEDNNGKKMIDDHIKSAIIVQLRNCVKLGIKFIHKSRKPVIDASGEYTYTSDYIQAINLQQLITDWSITSFD